MTQHRPVRVMGGSRGRVPTFADDWDAGEYSFGVSSLQEYRPVRGVTGSHRFFPGTFVRHIAQPTIRLFTPIDPEESGWVHLTRLGSVSDFDHAHGRPETRHVPAELSEALQELQEVTADAEEDGLDIPSHVAIANAERLLRAMYSISQRRFVVYPVSGGRIAIDARGPNDRIVVLTCDSEGGALCMVTINGEYRRARYSTARELPDGFIREALAALDTIPVL